jgi:hypothetical protein
LQEEQKFWKTCQSEKSILIMLKKNKFTTKPF